MPDPTPDYLWPPEREPDTHPTGKLRLCAMLNTTGLICRASPAWIVKPGGYIRCAAHPPPGYTLRSEATQ